ncbi:hypothetical protein [Erwinia sp. OPT-41]|uniref:Phage protein n=1 Tax=Erwinia plantamica TaxID=3237104 RepID=A0ABW7CL99_9GAMM
MSELKIVPFQKDEQNERNQKEIVRRLEEILKHVREGHFQTFAAVLISVEGDVMDCWHNGGKPYAMVGALESLKTDYIQACIERR